MTQGPPEGGESRPQWGGPEHPTQPQWPTQPPQSQGWGQPLAHPQGQPTGQQPAWGQPRPPEGPQKPRRPWYRRPWPVIGLIVLAFLVIGMLLPDPDPNPKPTTSPNTTMAQATVAESSPTTKATTKGTAGQTQETPGIGTPVRDGKFEFTVRKVECGKSRVGDVDFGVKAQGQFCFIYMKVENIGKEAQTLDSSAQYMYGSNGERYDTDAEASIRLDDSNTFLEDINPGNAVEGIVVFDIPKGAKPTKLELHDSPFSGGVEVEL
jgi:Domain of unknown function (DUF4352)